MDQRGSLGTRIYQEAVEAMCRDLCVEFVLWGG
jgi:hypothetical protein